MGEVEADVEGLPKAIVRRIVKDKLSQLSDDGDINVQKDALLAFSESARIFIHYLSATANDICKESKRQTMNADDVLKALEEIEFPEFIGPLKASLDEFKEKNAGKKAGAAKAKEANKKRKAEEVAVEDEGGEAKQGDRDEEARQDDEEARQDDEEEAKQDDQEDEGNEDGDDAPANE